VGISIGRYTEEDEARKPLSKSLIVSMRLGWLFMIEAPTLARERGFTDPVILVA